MYLLPLLFATSLAPDIATDKRLDSKIALTEYLKTAPEILADISKATGVKLETSPKLQDDLVVLITKPRSAREVMQVLAGHFSWRWTPIADGGYRLEPTEECLRKILGGYELSLRPRMRQLKADALASAAQQEKENTEATVEAVEKRIKLRLAQKTEPLELDGDEKCDVLSPLVCRAIASLSEAQLTDANRRGLWMSTDPGPLEVAIPGGVQSALPSAIRRTASTMSRFRKLDDQYPAPFNPDEVATVRFYTKGNSANKYQLLASDSRVLYEGSSFIRRQDRTAPPPIPSDLQPVIRQLKPIEELYEFSGEPLDRYGHAIAEVAGKSQLDVVSDAYDVYWSVGPEVNRWQTLMTLNVEGGWLKARSHDWTMLRPRTLPRSTWKRLGGRPVSQLTLDERGQLAAMLDWDQMRSPILSWEPTDAAFYRFWASLSADQKQGLRTGRTIPLARLPSAVHDYLYLAEEGTDKVDSLFGEGFFDEPEFGQPKPEPAEDQPTKPPSARDYAALYPRRLSGNAIAHGDSARIPGLYLPGYGPMPPVILAEADLNAAAAAGQELPKDMRLMVATALRFRFSLAKDLVVERQEVEVEIGKTTKFAPEAWPDELRHRIAMAKERAKNRGDENSGGTPPPKPLLASR